MTIDDVLSLQALSIRQPWASMIVTGMKSIELRTWATNYRGWLWIHSGKKPDAAALEMLGEAPERYQTGGLLGIALLSDVRRIETPREWQALSRQHRSPSGFQPDVMGWHFTDTIGLRTKIASPGELYLFPLSAATREPARAAIAADSDFLDAITDL